MRVLEGPGCTLPTKHQNHRLAVRGSEHSGSPGRACEVTAAVDSGPGSLISTSTKVTGHNLSMVPCKHTKGCRPRPQENGRKTLNVVLPHHASEIPSEWSTLQVGNM